MARENLQKAKAIAFDIMHYIFCAALILGAVSSRLVAVINIGIDDIIISIFFAVVGLRSLIVGIIFKKLEK